MTAGEPHYFAKLAEHSHITLLSWRLTAARRACKSGTPRAGTVLAGRYQQRAILLAVDRIDEMSRSMIQFIFWGNAGTATCAGRTSSVGVRK